MEKAIQYLINRYGVVTVTQSKNFTDLTEVTCNGNGFGKHDLDEVMEAKNFYTFSITIKNSELNIIIFFKNESGN